MTPVALPVRARLDEAGHLVEADPALADLQVRAGGMLPGPVCIPQIEAIARLALRVRAPIRRSVLAADGEDDLNLDIEARPAEEGGVELVIGTWSRQRAYAPADPHAPPSEANPNDRLEWESDATLILDMLKPFVAGARIGEVLTASFRLVEDEGGHLPLLNAVAARAGFSGQMAELRADGTRYALAGDPVFVHGRFRGYRGTARRLGAGDGEPPAIIPDSLEYALREPLETILADAERIATEADGPLEARHVGYARDILTAGRHLQGLIGDAMHLQAIERPDFSVTSSPIDLAEVAREAGAMVAPQAAAADVTIIVPPTRETCPALGDHRHVLEIAVNLVANALRYAPPGSDIALRTDPGGSEAALIVSDRGIGIEPAEHQRIFEKYQRVDPAEPGGSGLGLYIARRLARAMGGDVRVKSSPGDGAVFTLSLPRG